MKQRPLKTKTKRVVDKLILNFIALTKIEEINNYLANNEQLSDLCITCLFIVQYRSFDILLFIIFIIPENFCSKRMIVTR